MNWIKTHAHVLVAVVSGVGVVLGTVAANTAGMIPASANAWLAVIALVIAQSVGILAGGKVAVKHQVNEQLKLRLGPGNSSF